MKPPLWGYASHPLVVGDSLIVPVGGKGSGVVAFNKATGEELWKSVTTFDICYAPLMMYEPRDAKGEKGAESQLIFWHADGVTSLNPESGKEYWTVKFPEERNASQTAIATPTLCGKDGNQLLISEFYKGSLLLEIGSNPPSVTEKWRQFKTNPKLDEAMNSMMATPVVKDGHAYGVAFNGRGQGVLRCIDLATGAMTWNQDDWMSEKPQLFATAFITPNEDKYFIFDDIGELIIGKLSPEGFEELDRAKLLEPTSVARGRDVVWSHPAYANGKMYVRNDKEIICVDLKQSGDSSN
jgi:outer membrane protein assembly factor BamB